MNYIKEREAIVSYGLKLITENLTTGTGGNISMFLPDTNSMLISPSGIPYSEIKPEDIVLTDLDGNVLEGNRTPSSEHKMHSIFYKNKPHIRAVVHTHSDYATALSCLNTTIPPLHYLISSIGNQIVCCDYKTFGTQELAEEAYNKMADNNGILLGNHGSLAIGRSIKEAFDIAVTIEFIAKLYSIAKAAGEPKLLSQEDLEICSKKFKYYGQQPNN